MTPTWLDFDRLQTLLAVLTVLAAMLALVSLALLKPVAAKVLGVGLLVVVCGAAFWQHQRLDDARRTDCSRVEIVGTRVRVPACPRSTDS
jgi:hypothetical protein